MQCFVKGNFLIENCSIEDVYISWGHEILGDLLARLFWKQITHKLLTVIFFFKWKSKPLVETWFTSYCLRSKLSFDLNSMYSNLQVMSSIHMLED